MEANDNLNKYDNLHILLWLIKDTCWMLELKWLGLLIMFPTLYLALLIIYKTKGVIEFYLNLAIFCWIFANSFWMTMEFFFEDRFKNYSLIPFGFGLVFVGIFYFKSHNLGKRIF